MTRAHVGLGSNLGDRMATLDAAVRALDADELTHVMAVSRVYETAPVGGPEQDPYLNAVAVLETDRGPRDLLDLLLATEAGLGRVRAERWGPRTADLDLLLYGDAVLDTTGLVSYWRSAPNPPDNSSTISPSACECEPTRQVRNPLSPCRPIKVFWPFSSRSISSTSSGNVRPSA